MSIRSATPEDKVIGQKIRARRLLASMSQDTLASKLGVTFQQVQKYEKGVNRVTHARLVKVAEALGEDITFFLDDSKHTTSEQGKMMQAAMAHPEIQKLALSAMKLSPALRKSLLALVQTLEKS